MRTWFVQRSVSSSLAQGFIITIINRKQKDTKERWKVQNRVEILILESQECIIAEIDWFPMTALQIENEFQFRKTEQGQFGCSKSPRKYVPACRRTQTGLWTQTCSNSNAFSIRIWTLTSQAWIQHYLNCLTDNSLSSKLSDVSYCLKDTE